MLQHAMKCSSPQRPGAKTCTYIAEPGENARRTSGCNSLHEHNPVSLKWKTTYSQLAQPSAVGGMWRCGYFGRANVQLQIPTVATGHSRESRTSGGAESGTPSAQSDCQSVYEARKYRKREEKTTMKYTGLQDIQCNAKTTVTIPLAPPTPSVTTSECCPCPPYARKLSSGSSARTRTNSCPCSCPLPGPRAS